jgi:hypothetical protein
MVGLARSVPMYVYVRLQPLPVEKLLESGLVPIQTALAGLGHTCSEDSCDCGGSVEGRPRALV